MSHSAVEFVHPVDAPGRAGEFALQARRRVEFGTAGLDCGRVSGAMFNPAAPILHLANHRSIILGLKSIERTNSASGSNSA